MTKLTFCDYQERAYTAIQPHTDQKDLVLNWLVGVAEETGEVLSLFKHHFWGSEEIDLVALSKELGDILWYTNAIATALGIDLSVVAELNVEKLEHRFGGAFTTKASSERHSLESRFADTEVYKDLVSQLRLKTQEVDTL